jgi:5,10-methylenetetrahydrofolate reductase
LKAPRNAGWNGIWKRSAEDHTLQLKKFQQALQGERIAITADLTLTSSSGAADIAKQVELLGPWVDGLQVTDNPFAWTQMSALSAALLLQQQGVDPIPILNCRDRNRIALIADLLGLRALGVNNVLLTRGHKFPDAHPVKAAAVFDTNSRELVALAARLGEDEPRVPGNDFFIGVGARAFRPARSWNAESLAERSASGAQFLQTQLCFNTRILREYMRRLVDTRMTWKYSVIVSLAAIPSAVTARWLKQNMNDSRIPDAVVKRLEGAADAEQEGVLICAELMQEIAGIPGVSGINLMTMGNADHLAVAIQRSGLKA